MLSLTLPYQVFCFVASLVLVRHLVLQTRRHRSKRYSGCQSIAQHPLNGTFSTEYDNGFSKAFQDGHVSKFVAKQFDLSGSSTYEVRNLKQHSIYTSDPIVTQFVFTNLEDFRKDLRLGGRYFHRDGIMNQDGAAARRSRELLNPLFSRAELSELDHFDKFIDRMLALIPRDGSTIDMQPLLRKLFIDSSTEFVFGQSLDSLRDNSARSERFIAALNRASAEAGRRQRDKSVLQYFYAFWPSKKWFADIKVVHDYIDECIERHRCGSSKAGQKQDRYYLIEGMSKAISDPVKLRFQLLSVWLQARDTAAMLFTNVLFLLARNPYWWTQLREQTLKHDSELSVTSDLLKSIPLFRNVVFETFRLQSPLIRTLRVAARDTVLPRGGGEHGDHPAFVSKGTIVFADRPSTYWDPKIWGKDADVFRPNRFEGKHYSWEFAPFSAGPRGCPARQQVLLQCVQLPYRLMLEFESIEKRDPCDEYLEGVMMCLESRNGALIALHPAKQI